MHIMHALCGYRNIICNGNPRNVCTYMVVCQSKLNYFLHICRSAYSENTIDGINSQNKWELRINNSKRILCYPVEGKKKFARRKLSSLELLVYIIWDSILWFPNLIMFPNIKFYGKNMFKTKKFNKNW